MSDDAASGVTTADADAPAAEAKPGFGATLARAREARGLSVVDVAARLRLHPRQIAALEEERLEALPAAPFVRGFVRNYAKELHLDPAPLLTALDGRLPVAEAMAVAGAGLAPTEVRHAGVERTSRVAVIGGSLLLLVVLGLIGWVASQRPQPTTSAAAPAAVAGAPQPDGAAERAAPSTSTAAPPATEPAASVSTSSAAAAASTPPASAAAPAPAAAPGTGLRLVVGERPSWVEITQADGRVLLTGLQEPGTERRIGSVQPPLQLVVGNASSVTLEYRGRTVDLARHIRANDLARLTLE